MALLSIDQKMVVLGDMNAHSLRWEYGDLNASAKEFEELLNSIPL